MALLTRRSGSLTTSSPGAASPREPTSAALDADLPRPSPRPKRQLSPLEPLRVLGQLLVWLGGLMLLFAAFQLWGTGLLEWRAQRGLEVEFDQLMEEARAGADDRTAAITAAIEDARADSEAPDDAAAELADTTADLPDTNFETTTTATPPTTAPPAPPEPELVRVSPDSGLLPAEGAPIARIEIPAIGVRKTIVQGVKRQTLRAGPGHYPSTPMPGQPGNAAIAGHRTTHGSPFLNIDRLKPGDHIDVETVDGVFRYEVEGHSARNGATSGHFIVHPSEVGVITDQGDDRLTLTACHPRYSARQRIIVTAVLVGEPSPEPVVVADPSTEAAEELATEEPAAEELAADVGGTVDENPVFEALDPIPGELPDAVPQSTDRELEADSAAVSGTDWAGEVDSADDIDPFQTVDPDPDTLEESLGWRMQELDPTVLWGVIFAVVVFAGWVLARLWRKRWAYVITTPIAVVPLFLCFVHLDRLLPAF